MQTLDAVDERFVEDAARYRFACGFVAGRTVLDVACGSGYGCRLLAEAGGARQVVGADVSDAAIAQARTFARRSVSFVRSSGAPLAFRDAVFDAIVSLETIEHVEDPRALLREFRRVLRPGGTAVISTPLNESPGRLRPGNPFHVREYNATEFVELAGTAFDDVRVHGQFTNYADGDAWIDRWRLAAPGRLWAVARSLVPVAARRALRTTTASGSRGRRAVQSSVENHAEGAAVQIAVCR